MPKKYNDQVLELRKNLETLKTIDINNPEWATTIQQIETGLNNIKTDKFMQPVNGAAKETLNRRMSEWISKNTAGGEYLDQVKQLQASL